MKYVNKFSAIYEPHFKMCDDILQCLLDDVKPIVDLTKKDFLAEEDTQVIASIKTLEKDGYIIRKDDHRKVQVTGEGIAFRKLDGYKYKFQYEDYLAWMVEKQLQSSIDTNVSTHKLNDNLLPKSLIAQKKLSKWSLYLAAISIAFIGITAYFQMTDKTAKEVKSLWSEEQKTLKALEDIQTSLKEINSSMKNVTTDTILVRRK